MIPRGHLFALTTCLLWSFSFVNIVYLDQFTTTLQLVALRMDFLALALLPMLVWRRPPLHRLSARDWILLASLGIIGGPLYHLILAWGVDGQRTDASLIGLIIATVPVHTAWIAWLVLGERPTWRRGLGIAIGLCGVAVVLHSKFGHLNLWQDDLAGPLTVTLAAVFAATMLVLMRKARTVLGPLDLVIVSSLIGAVAALTWQPFCDMPSLTAMPAGAWGAAFYLGVPAMAIAYVTWAGAVAVLPATSVALYTFLTCVFSTIWAWKFQGDEIRWGFAGGAVLVLAGIVIGSVTGGASKARRADPPSTTRDAAAP